MLRAVGRALCSPCCVRRLGSSSSTACNHPGRTRGGSRPRTRSRPQTPSQRETEVAHINTSTLTHGQHTLHQRANTGPTRINTNTLTEPTHINNKVPTQSQHTSTAMCQHRSNSHQHQDTNTESTYTNTNMLKQSQHINSNSLTGSKGPPSSPARTH